MLKNQHVALLALALLAGSCAVRQNRFRLVGRDSGAILIPPGVAKADLDRRAFTSQVTVGGRPCPPETGGVTVRPRRQRLRVTIRRGGLLQQPPGWLSDWVAALEAQSCIVLGAGPQLASEIASALPLDPTRTLRLLYVANEVDISPGARIQVVSPILREGAPADAPLLEPTETAGDGNTLTLTVRATANLIGVETAWYGVEPKPRQSGFTITPLAADRNLSGAIEHRPGPAVNRLPFPPEAAFYRLFYKADSTDLTALVLAAPTRAELDARTRVLEDGKGTCDKLPGNLCIAIPKSVGINVFVPVQVNGHELLVGRGAPLANAIREPGRPYPTRVPPGLSLSRPYRGRLVPVEFDSSSPAILGLPLLGGEVLSWLEK